MELVREQVLKCFASDMSLIDTERSVRVGTNSIKNKYPDIHALFVRRDFVKLMAKDALIAEEWVNNLYCSYHMLQRVIQRKHGITYSDNTIRLAIRRYMPEKTDYSNIITLSSKV